MKWVAYLLCLVILALWALAMSVPPESGALKQVHRLPRVARLQLAGELKQTKKPAVPRAGSAPVSGASYPLTTSVAPSLSGSAPAPSLAPSGFTSAMLPGSGQTGPTSGAETTEVGGSVTSAQRPQVTSGAVSKPDSAPPPACLVVVNIDSGSQARALVTDMADQGVKGEVRAREEPLPPLNWVLTPTYHSRSAALKALKSFQRQGVDSFLVTQGDMANAISLGIFQSASAAHQLIKKLKSRGIKARMAPYERSRKVYSARFPGLTRAQAAALRKRVAAPEKPLGNEQIIDCLGVASTDKSP